MLEYEKFARGKKLRIAKIPFVKLADIMIQQAEALVINPMGFNLILNREQLKRSSVKCNTERGGCEAASFQLWKDSENNCFQNMRDVLVYV